ncbi:hypothetical protein OF83DRAFT_128072 [Amylostereum chailletii]|nr:hypothetical protein OF83DRAFT_128072 [Amylostereum chailletii]
MTGMVHSLYRLSVILPPLHEVEDSIRERIKAMCDTMKDFGDFSDFYYTKCQAKIVRLLRSSDFKERLDGYVDAFNTHRDDIHFHIAALMAVQQTQIGDNVEEVLVITRQVDITLADTTQILNRFEVLLDDKEKKGLKFIEEHGGLKGFLDPDNEEALNTLARNLDERLTSRTRKVLHGDLKQIIEDNSTQFLLKLHAAQNGIQASVAQSRDEILRRLEKGPHELIENPDIREIWKKNGWKVSVKYRHFMDAVCAHFSDEFAKEAVVPSEGISPNDYWTMAVISKVTNHLAIGDAIDEDASGFLSISEINRFMNRRPEDWSTPVWLAFWATGFQRLNFEYTWDIEKHLDDIKEASKEAKQRLQDEPQNDHADKASMRGCIDEYLRSIDILAIFLEWVNHVEYPLLDYSGQGQHINAEVDHIVEIFSIRSKEKVVTRLESIGYRIDDHSLVSSITGQSRIEQVLLQLLSLILPKQLDEIRGLNNAEALPHYADFTNVWETMHKSLTILIILLHERMLDLIRGWRSQKLDMELQIEFYAGGLYTAWYSKYITPVNDIRKLVDPLINGPFESVRHLVKRVAKIESGISNIESKLELLVGMVWRASGTAPLPQGQPEQPENAEMHTLAAQSEGDDEFHSSESSNEPAGVLGVSPSEKRASRFRWERDGDAWKRISAD